jgi:hypothetical protein
LAETRGRPETTSDRLFQLTHRLMKFLRHPMRTATQRVFFRRTLDRWTL